MSNSKTRPKKNDPCEEFFDRLFDAAEELARYREGVKKKKDLQKDSDNVKLNPNPENQTNGRTMESSG